MGGQPFQDRGDDSLLRPSPVVEEPVARLAPPGPVESPSVPAAIRAATRWLQDEQKEDGFWVGMLESNSGMEAQWVLAMHFLGVEEDPKYERVVQGILNEQRDDGSWEVYYDAPTGDINTTVECYAALRSAGFAPDHPALEKARAWIFDNGGLSRIRNFTKYWLALIGEWPWRGTPTLPPELMFLPRWAPFNLYRFASWARGTIVPLCILSARRPVRRLPPERRLDELFPDGREEFDYSLRRKKGWASWEGLFFAADRVLQRYAPLPIKPGRELAIKMCLEWILKRQEVDGSWSGIQPPWIYSLMALHVEGYLTDHPVLRSGLDAFNKHWSYERDGGVYLQASESPVWDTILAMLALLDCGETPASCPELAAGLEWLLSQQVEAWGDWCVFVRGAKGGGWAFQRANAFYPDVDDTAVALIVLAKARRVIEDTSRVDRAIESAVEWMLAMQHPNGGWAAFDRDNDDGIITKIPFCDFGEVLDPPSVDVTAHAVEALAELGRTADDPAVAAALQFIRDEQEADGSWFGRWGVNHIYGTAAVLPALQAVGEDMARRVRPTGRRVDRGAPERGRRLGRDARFLRRREAPRRGGQRAVADRVGVDGPPGSRRSRAPRGDRSRGRLSRRAPGRRHVGRAAVHRHGVPRLRRRRAHPHRRLRRPSWVRATSSSAAS